MRAPLIAGLGLELTRKSAQPWAAFAGWDAGGAKLFGYPPFWVNRQGQSAGELGAMADLVRFVLAPRRL